MNRTVLAACASACFLMAGRTPAEAQAPAPGRVREPIVGLPCEGCEVVYDGLPETLASGARIAPEGAPGQPMRIEGTVRDRLGRAQPGIIVDAYHTDARGIYPKDETRSGPTAFHHGRLRGWVRTDERLKLLIAYSTLAQIGYLFLMFPLDFDAASGQFVRGAALTGGTLQAIAHASAKAAMFMVAGRSTRPMAMIASRNSPAPRGAFR